MTEKEYIEPVVSAPWHSPPRTALPLAASGSFFSSVNIAERRADGTVHRRRVELSELRGDLRNRAEQFCVIPPAVAGLSPRHQPGGRSRVLVMGILNLTPDSFHAPSRVRVNASPRLREVTSPRLREVTSPRLREDACQNAARQLEEGADLLDIGGESTRPGSSSVSAEEEWQRLEPVLTALTSLRNTPSIISPVISPVISVDTRKPELFARATAAGAQILNDVSGFAHADALTEAAKCSSSWFVCMHSQGTPRTMQKNPRYQDVVADVHDWFAERLAAMENAGIPRARVILDPGIGFGKTLAHNLALMRSLATFCEFGCPLLVGLSRKSWIQKIDDHPSAQTSEGRLAGSLTATALVAGCGASILRTHDPRPTRQALAVLDGFNMASM
ncbi:MAG: dihydropteroate synthase [Alphaproteobacteria bacterium]